MFGGIFPGHRGARQQESVSSIMIGEEEEEGQGQ